MCAQPFLVITRREALFARIRSLVSSTGAPCRRLRRREDLASAAEPVCIVDHRPRHGSDALPLVRETASRGCRPSLVLIVGSDGAAHEAIEAGAVNCLPESRMDAFTLTCALRHAHEHATLQGELIGLRQSAVPSQEDQLLRALAGNLPVVTGRIDPGGIVATAIGSLFGSSVAMTTAHLVGRNVLELYPESAPHVRRALAGESVNFPWVGFIAGRERCLQNYVFFDAARGGGAIFLSCDVTASKVLERALVESREHFQMLLERSLDAILLIDERGICIKANNVASSLLGFPIEQLIGRRASEFGLKQFQLPRPGVLVKTSLASAGQLCQLCFMRPDGQTRLIEYGVYRASPHFQLCILRDVTEHRRLEREILEISDLEQRRFSQDLHDGLGQHLTGVAYMAEALSARLAARGSPDAGSAAQISALLGEAVSQARDIARGVYPAELTASDLPDALGHLAANVRTLRGTDCRLELEGEPHALAGPAAMHLYRIAQEAVDNACRHGRAGAITMRLVSTPSGGVELSVKDNGRGFRGPDAGEEPGRGLGLHMMNYRATLLGGSVAVVSDPKDGTLVKCVVRSAPEALPREPARRRRTDYAPADASANPHR